MAKQNVTPQEASLGEAVSKTESFFENNSKLIIGVLTAIVVVIAGWYCYDHFVIKANNAEASKMIAEAQYRFEAANPDYELALNGDENGAGFLAVIDEYGSTPAGNLAKHYAGICYLHLGDLNAAADYLSKFSTVKGLPGEIINAQNYGLQGDVALELGDYAKAVNFYQKAVKASENSYTAPLYMRKQGLALLAQGKTEEATAVFHKLLSTYPASSDAVEVQKLIGSEE